MAYEDITRYQKTATPNFSSYSNRDIDQKFNQVEFNRIFTLLDQEKINNTSENSINCSKKSKINILLIITFIITMSGILLLLYNNFIKINNDSLISQN